MPLVVRDEEVAGPDNVTNAPDGQGGAKPARRFLTRVTADVGSPRGRAQRIHHEGIAGRKHGATKILPNLKEKSTERY